MNFVKFFVTWKSDMLVSITDKSYKVLEQIKYVFTEYLFVSNQFVLLQPFKLWPKAIFLQCVIVMGSI